MLIHINLNLNNFFRDKTYILNKKRIISMNKKRLFNIMNISKKYLIMFGRILKMDSDFIYNNMLIRIECDISIGNSWLTGPIEIRVLQDSLSSMDSILHSRTSRYR